MAQTRTNPLPWKGQFSPQLIEVLLRAYGTAGAHVVDPFVGSGTVLGECARTKYAATGIEVNPGAAILARVYAFANLAKNDRLSIWEKANRSLVRALAAAQADITADAIANVRPQVVARASERADPAAMALIKAALVLSDPTWSDVRADRLLDASRRLREVLLSLPYSSRPLRVLDGDARRLPLEPHVADLVITSPPYINVFNYHQQYRPAVEALGHDVLEVARSEIGSNRKHRMNRFLTVIQYAIDMTAVLHETVRVTKNGGRIIVVVGRESRVRGLPVLNGDLLCALATAARFVTVEMRQERSFLNRFGERIVEDILHFRPGGSDTRALDQDVARTVGVKFLERIGHLAQGEVRDDIVAAIRLAPTVQASPLHASTASL